MAALQFPIQVVSRLTGLSPHVIRVWEKRYQAVIPARSDTNRRLYSEAEVDRLRLLAQATEAGHKIGIIARLTDIDLHRLVATVPPSPSGPTGGPQSTAETVTSALSAPPQSIQTPSSREPRPRSSASAEQVDAHLVADAVEATRHFNADRLQRALEQGAVRLGHNGLLHRVIRPLAHDLGELWQRGEITAAHEHFASAIIRDHLMRNARPYAVEDHAPCAVIGTPTGQLHELGAVMVTAAAAHRGWRPVYLGASLPPAEIAGAAVQNNARAVLLSMVYPTDDRLLPSDLKVLRRMLPPHIEIVVGGRAAPAYLDTLKEIGAILPDGLDELGDLLDEMRLDGPETWPIPHPPLSGAPSPGRPRIPEPTAERPVPPPS